MTTTNGHNNHITNNFSPTIKSVINSADSKAPLNSTTDNNETVVNLKSAEESNRPKLSASEIFSFINSQLKEHRKSSSIEEAIEQFRPAKKDDSGAWGGTQAEDVAERTTASSTTESVVKEAEVATQNFTEETSGNNQSEKTAKIQKEALDKAAQDIADAADSDSTEVNNEKVNSIWRAIFG